MIERIDHIGIAVSDLEQAVILYRDVFGLNLLRYEEVADQKVKTALFSIGDIILELLAPSDKSSPIARHIEKRGEGFHHIAFKSVDDLEKSLAILEQKGLTLIDKTPRLGAHDNRIAFLNPKSTGGLLVELCRK